MLTNGHIGFKLLLLSHGGDTDVACVVVVHLHLRIEYFEATQAKLETTPTLFGEDWGPETHVQPVAGDDSPSSCGRCTLVYVYILT